MPSREELMNVLTRYEGALQEHADSPDDSTAAELEAARAALMDVLMQCRKQIENQ